MSSLNSDRRSSTYAHLVLCLVALSVSACGLALDTDARLERASQALEDGDFRAAIIDTRNLLQDEPDNVEARLLLGRASAAIGDAASAEKEFRRAIELGADRASVIVDLAAALLQLRRFDQLLKDIQPEFASDENDRKRLLQFRGEAALSLKLYASARDSFEQILEVDSKNVAALVGIASVHAGEGDTDAARQILDEARELDPDYGPGWLVSATLRLLAQDPQGAIEDLNEALSIGERLGDIDLQVSALTGLAEAELGRRNLEAASNVVDRLSEIAPERLETRFYRARVAFVERDFDLAQSELETVLQAVPGDTSTVLLLGAVHLEKGNLGQAEMHLTTVLAREPDNARARRMLVETRLRQDRADEAAAILGSGPGGPGDPATVDLAVRASIASGNYDDAIEFLRNAIEAEPDNEDLKLELAAAFLAAGMEQEAEQILSELPHDWEKASYERQFLSVISSARLDDLTSALAKAQEMATEWPEDARVHNIVGGILLGMDRVDDAYKSFTKAAELEPGNISAHVNLARLDARGGDFEAAKRQYLDALEYHPASTELMVAISQVEARAENVDSAVEWLKKARAADDEAVLPRRVLADYYVASGDADSAAKYAEEALALDPDNPEVLNTLGVIGLRQQDFAAAASRFSRASSLDSSVDEFRLNEARAQYLLGNTAIASQRLQGLDVGPENLDAAMLQVAIAYRLGDIEKVSTIVQGIKKHHSDSDLPFILEGALAEQAGNYEAAAEAYDRAMELQPDNRPIAVAGYRVRRLGSLGNEEATLLEYLEVRPTDNDVKRILGSVYLRSGRADRAAEVFEELLRESPDDPGLLNNLAWIYLQTSNPRAEEFATKAYEMAPDSAPVLDTYGWIKVQQGEITEGLTALRRAKDLSGSEPDVIYHLAFALLKAGETGEAKRLLTSLVRSDQQFAARPDAEQLLDSIQ